MGRQLQNRLELAQYFAELGFKRGVEVGVAEGIYSLVLCQNIPGLELHCVDPWDTYKDNQRGGGKEKQHHNFELAKEKLTPYNVTFHRKMSMDAVRDFEDGSLDFVYIDANHQDPYITQDIVEWTKKVRSGGIVAGHDYVKLKHTRVDVIKAVNKYVKEKNLALFILGSSARNTGEMRERVRSWMFIKK